MHTQTHQHTCIHTHTFLCSSYFIQIGRPPFELKSLLWKHTPNGAHQEGQGSCRRAKTEARGRFVRWVFDLFLSGECWSFEISNSTLHVRVLLIIWDLTAQMSMCGFCWSFEILQLNCSCVGFADHLRSYSSDVHVWVLLIIWDLAAQLFNFSCMGFAKVSKGTKSLSWNATARRLQLLQPFALWTKCLKHHNCK